jgi:hypothetical protein
MRNDSDKKYRGGFKRRDRILYKKLQGEHDWCWYHRKIEAPTPLTDIQKENLKSFLRKP